VDERHFGSIWFIRGPNKGRYPNCHSIYIEGPGILIDPSADRKRLEELKGNPGVKVVLLSHVHEDHLMHLDLFHDVPLWVPASDAPQITDIELLLNTYCACGEMRDYYRKILEEQFHFHPRKPDRLLKDGDIVDAGGLTIQIIHTPGHTPGHLCFLFSEPRILFLCDYDLTPFGPWYGDTHSSIEETIRSVARLESIPADIWLTSHEDGIFEANPGRLWQEYIEVINARETKLLELLETPQTLEEIARSYIVYKKPRQPEKFYLFNEQLIMEKHLSRLIQKGQIVQDHNRFVRL
jgi:glyoxylase-like metal-dependent hydrolase (beta-lactamase superfamily II)